MNSELKKIIFVTQNLAPFRIDWLDELAKYFQIKIFYYKELDLKGKTNPAYMKRRPKKALYKQIEGMNSYNRAMQTAKSIAEINDNNTLVLLDGYGFLEQILLIGILKRRKIRYGITIDGIIPKENEKKYVYKMKSNILTSAEFVLSTSKEVDKVIEFYGVERENIFRHVFTPLFENDIIKVEQLNYKNEFKRQIKCQDKFIVMSVGKMIKSKGFDINLQLAKENPHLYFIVIGGKPTEEFIKYVKNENLSNIKFVDFCDKVELHSYYMAADIFFHPTRTDVWGLVINEAMAHGLPVITTNKCGAGVELIQNGQHGFIVTVDDIQDMNNKLNYLYSNPAVIEKMSLKNLKTMKENTIEKSTYNDFNNLISWRNCNE